MSIDAFIFVGGRSRRLGRDKALEAFGGMTLAERALQTINKASVASKVSFVTGNQVEFAIEAARLDAPFVFDLVEGRGPLGGFYTALTNTAAKWVFILACDMPFVTAGLIVKLSQFVADDNGSIGAVIPEQPDGRMQPLCAFYKVATALPVVEEIVARPRVSPPMHEVAMMLSPLIVKPADYSVPDEMPACYFANVNTEEDLTAARELAREISNKAVR